MTQKREEVDLRPDHALFPGTFSQMTFITSGNTEIYFRDYKKLFDVIVQIGGFSNGIIYSATILLYFYSNNIILWKCIYGLISSKELGEILDKPVIGNVSRFEMSEQNNMNPARDEEERKIDSDQNNNDNNNERNARNFIEQIRVKNISKKNESRK